MKLESIKCQCEFFHEFESVGLPEDSYGGFLLWSASGEKAYLDSASDKTYDEVSGLIDSDQNDTPLNDDARANILQKIYGLVACDLDHKGSAFALVAHQPCPVCGASKMRSWDYEKPAKIVGAEMGAVTHAVWMGLSTTEKAGVVRGAILRLEK